MSVTTASRRASPPAEAKEPAPSTNGARTADRELVIPAIRVERLVLTLVGDSPLICHRWSEKAKKEMVDKQTKRARQAKEAKDPLVDFRESLYWLTEKPDLTDQALLDFIAREACRFGFPAIAFKAAAVDACTHVDAMTKVAARGVFHIDAEILEIEGSKPRPREDMVRVGMGTADIRYRGQFDEWRVRVPIRYNGAVYTAEQITNLFNVAGFSVGVGDWRPARDGSFGLFHVEGVVK
jgi:hypothetical protein